MAIITVSRQGYSFGDEIAKQVANDLGYTFIDKEKIGEALALLGLSDSQMERYDEKKPSIWDTLAIHHNKFLCLMNAAIYDFAGNDDTLIIGRGGQILLKDFKGVMHIRIVAPFKVRLSRLMEQEGHDEKNAEKVLRQSDRDSSGYIRSYFGLDWNNPDLYDMMINTQTISIPTATEMILSAVHSNEFLSDPINRSDKLTALALQKKAEAVIMDIQRGDMICAVVTDVDKCEISLRGTTNSASIKEQCGQAISKITGVREIKNEIAIVKSI